jgi:hypothetical protein
MHSLEVASGHAATTLASSSSVVLVPMECQRRFRMSFVANAGGLSSCRRFSFEGVVRKWFLFNRFLFGNYSFPAGNEAPSIGQKLLTR